MNLAACSCLSGCLSEIEEASMRVVACSTPEAAGELGAAVVAARLNHVLAGRERARLLLSTGESQFETLRSLVRRPVEWGRVDAFHLDEYADLPREHPASFRRYLDERVASVIPLRMHYVDPSSPGELKRLSETVAETPMDVGLIGIGRNGHIAFNDPPADFTATSPYLEVELDAACRAQQVDEGWFETAADVPARAITMSVQEIMRSREIVSVVPHAAKAPVIRRLLTSGEVTPDLPASMLTRHDNALLVLDRGSSQLLPDEIFKRCIVL
jgi:glucosamine-6-phosphate deaminase